MGVNEVKRKLMPIRQTKIQKLVLRKWDSPVMRMVSGNYRQLQTRPLKISYVLSTDLEAEPWKKICHPITSRS